MRTVRFCINMSLDGYCDHTAFSPDEAVLEYFTAMIDDVDLLFFGRIMYQLMFPYWREVARDQSGCPAENRFAEKLSTMDSVVISRSLDVVGENVLIVRSDPAGELLKLKQQVGKTILMDSVSLLPEMIAAGLIDEFFLVIHPVIVGNGRHLLDTGSLHEKLNLQLFDTIKFKSGSIALHYVKSGF
ncbi:dihydrofolate reductase family protein [Sphingobacterium corticibacterium]|uniref:Deaminase n=1 Tax=Sphingobacterium corticibacterium TaxID=2484746 RepID=A0A4V2DCT0_9SPHI|nr:dihydrofolate reductase family protein [Sphingobacterium corticibacterium]RZF62558.1 deaminase [Sphingobacterium corticibacterium]